MLSLRLEIGSFCLQAATKTFDFVVFFVTGHSRLEKEVKEMAQGTVKWFNDSKGFGFYGPSGLPEDVKRSLVSAIEKAVKNPELKGNVNCFVSAKEMG